MAEYIEKSDLYNKICERVNNPAIRSWLGSIINDIPAADVEPVRRGEWIGKQLDNFKKYQVTCSECGWIGIENYDSYVDPSDFNYCPNCGANMEYEEDDP